MLTNKQAISKIRKVYNNRYEKYEELYEWFCDVDTKTSYAWKFYDQHRNLIEIVCYKISGEVQVRVR